MSKETYADYRESNHWQNLRVLCHARFSGKCVICESESALQCHHWIYRRTFQETTIADLVLLCDSCHGMVHREGSHKMPAEELSEKYRRFFVNVPQAPRSKALHPGSNEWKLAIRARNKGKPAIPRQGCNDGKIKGLMRKRKRLLRRQEKETDPIARKARQWQIAKLEKAMDAIHPRRSPS